MLKSRLFGYSGAYILVTGTITITGVGDHDEARQRGERNKVAIF